MLKYTVEDFLTNLLKLSRKDKNELLTKLGWKINPLRHKEFSNFFVDANGELKGFNPVENSIEHLVVTA